MHYRIHKVHKVRYGAELPDDMTSHIVIDLLSEQDSFHRNLDGTQIEISFEDLKAVIDAQPEGEVKEYLKTIYFSADNSEEFVYIDFC